MRNAKIATPIPLEEAKNKAAPLCKSCSCQQHDWAMRHGRLKRIRRALTFYKVCYHFREPYKVLLDGNFLHACVCLKLGDIRQAVAKLLGASVRVFVTKCVQAELQALGKDYTAAAAMARQLDGLSGGLTPPATAAESLLAAVGERNGEHFFVGTQDESLREKLRKIPGVPQLYVHSTGIALEIPTEAQRQEAAQRSVVPAHERTALQIDTPGRATSADAIHTNVRFKRNKAKGPNPLSVKKKRKREEPPPQTKPAWPKQSVAAMPLPQQQQQQSMATQSGGGQQTEGGKRKRPRRKRRADDDGARPGAPQTE